MKRLNSILFVGLTFILGMAAFIIGPIQDLYAADNCVGMPGFDAQKDKCVDMESVLGSHTESASPGETVSYTFISRALGPMSRGTFDKWEFEVKLTAKDAEGNLIRGADLLPIDFHETLGGDINITTEEGRAFSCQADYHGYNSYVCSSETVPTVPFSQVLGKITFKIPSEIDSLALVEVTIRSTACNWPAGGNVGMGDTGQCYRAKDPDTSNDSDTKTTKIIGTETKSSPRIIRQRFMNFKLGR